MSSCTESDPLLRPAVISEPSDTPEISTMSETNNSFNCFVKVFLASILSLAYLLMGASIFVVLWFALKSSPITVFQLHIIFSVIGYQLLMSYGILSLNIYNGWSSPLTILHRHRAHWILQLIGSGLAIAGSMIMMREKTVNFNSIHGKLALAALTATCVSLVNGLMTLYRIRISRVIPAKVFKSSHVFLGTAAFTLSSLCLAFGYNKKSFRDWASDELSFVIIGFTSVYTVIVIAKPCYVMWKILTKVIKTKIF